MSSLIQPLQQLQCASGERPTGSTGNARLDQLLGGGLPGGEIVEITGARSSGRTALLFSILAHRTRKGERVGYIDTFDTFDPVSAEKAGILLKRTLWVRCRQTSFDKSVARAMKALDILTRTESFSLVVVDLETAEPGSAGAKALVRIPFQNWFRVRRSLRGKTTAVVTVGGQAWAGSAAAVVIEMKRDVTRWRSATNASPAPQLGHARLLRGISSQLLLKRGKRHGGLTIHSDF